MIASGFAFVAGVRMRGEKEWVTLSECPRSEAPSRRQPSALYGWETHFAAMCRISSRCCIDFS